MTRARAWWLAKMALALAPLVAVAVAWVAMLCHGLYLWWTL